MLLSFVCIIFDDVIVFRVSYIVDFKINLERDFILEVGLLGVINICDNGFLVFVVR